MEETINDDFFKNSNLPTLCLSPELLNKLKIKRKKRKRSSSIRGNSPINLDIKEIKIILVSIILLLLFTVGVSLS